MTRLLWRRRHPFEVGDIFRRLVPRSPPLRVDNGLRGKPIVLVETPHRYADHTGPRRIFSIHATAARRAEIPGVDVPAVSGRGIAGSLALNGDIIFLEESQRHMPRSRRSLAVLAMTL